MVPEVERKVRGAEVIIQRVLRLRISLTFRQVELAMSSSRAGNISSLTRPKDHAAKKIQIYGKQVVPPGGGAVPAAVAMFSHVSQVGRRMD